MPANSQTDTTGTTLYGISNCDTIKKARRWLAEADVPYTFHDYRKLGIDDARLHSFCEQFGWESVLNRRGTTWRKLDEADKEGVDLSSAVALMKEHTSLIKRPIVEHRGQRLLGFKVANYEALFQT